jgi:Tol biopolymer transport system component
VTLSGERRLIARVPGNATLHDVNRDGAVLMAHTDDRQGILARSPGDTTETDLSWLDASSLSDLSPDGRFILFSEIGQGGGSGYSVYFRRTDGSAAVRLGSGRAIALSPDANWALCFDAALQPFLLPTGAGETRRISTLLRYRSARWLPDGQRAVVLANEEGSSPRLYVADLTGGTHKTITPEGIGAWALSPDGSTVAARGADRAIRLYPVAGGEVRTIPGTTGRESPVGWIADGRLVVHVDAPEYSLKTIFRLDPATGRQEVWKRIEPRDQAGLMFLYQFRVTPDGRSYAYSWHRAISDLYLVRGV